MENILMSGKRHHFLPQFLLRGFLSRVRKKQELSFIFRSDGSHLEQNIKNIAVESRFYDNEDSSADPIITYKENDYARAIKNIRTSGAIAPEELKAVVSFVVHLIARSKYTRSFLEDSTQYLVDNAEKCILDDRNLIPMIEEKMSEEETINLLKTKLSEMLPDQNDFVVTKLASKIFNENREELIQNIHKILKEFGPTFFSSCRDKIFPGIAKSQNTALQKDEIETERFKRYMDLKWSVKNYEEESLILGDLGPFAINKKGDVTAPIFGHDLFMLMFPISSKMILIGGLNDSDLDLSVTEINSLTASMSLQFFVASQENLELTRLLKLIGSKSINFYRNTIDSLTASMFRTEQNDHFQ